MQIDRIPFPDVPQFSAKDVAYATADPRLAPFYKYPVTLSAFGDVMQDKAKDATDRSMLVEVLRRQYAKLPNNKRALTQVQRLGDEATFTVITAHQPSLFTGPLYFIYKICSCLNLAAQLNETYPENHVVPVFVMGGEDHDFAEINHARVKGKLAVWEETEGGSVAAMPTENLSAAIQKLKDILGEDALRYDPVKSLVATIEKAYLNNDTYGAATVELVHTLFANTDLVVADMAQLEFKRAFLPIMERELFEQVSQPLIEKAQDELTAAGFSGQVHAREINLFYLSPGRRDRIVLTENGYQINDTSTHFSEEEMRKELRDHPERFSPNVVMRPLFQETIFPNLAYIGGGGELAYWLERKEQFAVFKLNFPMLIRRNSVLWIDPRSGKKINQLGTDFRAFFQPTDKVIKDYVAEHSRNDLSLDEAMQQIETLYDQLAARAKQVDPTLEKHVLAMGAHQNNKLENLEERLRRREKRKYTEAVERIRFVRSHLFPGDSLQERKDNFLNLYLDHGPDVIPTLIRHLDPLTPGMVVIH
ncbi:bacillithiol biosynthesis cysteine-adding enzyme BshC [Lewinella sp. 4G2]|uniref:bacillithiol biosynthesis cysteine-adding enzyme BshC n=1 Tax=Lewinella sp. 4G2 TaxID=1803372 RepID=UPI0007B498AE|nr:bacillithiol biosynthesis cysteine-adding enzyme BshC [Lewinella sp. 4G2]OAV45928.1 bacillithiol biosynthesis cysteine-adding enzyme BshC [Lewinella sp. 4G2]